MNIEQEAKLRACFDERQFNQFVKITEVIAGPFTDDHAKKTIVDLFYNSLLAAYAAGRFRGVCDSKSLIVKTIDDFQAGER